MATAECNYNVVNILYLYLTHRTFPQTYLTVAQKLCTKLAEIKYTKILRSCYRSLRDNA
jgi:hypothetical protein